VLDEQRPLYQQLKTTLAQDRCHASFIVSHGAKHLSVALFRDTSQRTANQFCFALSFVRAEHQAQPVGGAGTRYGCPASDLILTPGKHKLGLSLEQAWRPSTSAVLSRSFRLADQPRRNPGVQALNVPLVLSTSRSHPLGDCTLQGAVSTPEPHRVTTVHSKASLPQYLLFSTVRFYAGKQLLDVMLAGRNAQVEKQPIPQSGGMRLILDLRGKADDAPGVCARLTPGLNKSLPRNSTVDCVKHIGERSGLPHKVSAQGLMQGVC